MQKPQIETWQTRVNLLDRLAGRERAYVTKISDGLREAIGRGATPEASLDAAQTRLELIEPFTTGSAVMYP
jgi:hypothetical protein